MIRAEGAEKYFIRCINPRRQRYTVAWDFQPKEEVGFTYMEQEFDHLPTIEEIREVIYSYYNTQTDEKIRTGFVYGEKPVYLSIENQFNYKAAHDIAVQSNGANLPVRFKFGTDEEPDYHDFTTVEELKYFYTSAMQFIQQTLAAGWETKDSIDFNNYRL